MFLNFADVFKFFSQSEASDSQELICVSGACAVFLTVCVVLIVYNVKKKSRTDGEKENEIDKKPRN